MKTSKQIVTAAVMVVLVGCVSNLTARQQFDGRYDNRGGRFDNDRGSRFDDRGSHYDNRGFDRCERDFRQPYWRGYVSPVRPIVITKAVAVPVMPVVVTRYVTLPARQVAYVQPVFIQPQVVYVTNSRCR